MSIYPSDFLDSNTTLPDTVDSDITPTGTQEDSLNKSASSPYAGERVACSEDSDTETEMSDRRQSKHHESTKLSVHKSSSKSTSVSSSKSSSKSSKSKDDWTDVHEPDERRRIQNRIAQRKFREKTKEQKEARERATENQQYAGLTYSTPDPLDMASDAELSGLPWGSLSLKHVVDKGYMRARESGRGSNNQSPSYHYGMGGGSGSGRESESRSR